MTTYFIKNQKPNKFHFTLKSHSDSQDIFANHEGDEDEDDEGVTAPVIKDLDQEDLDFIKQKFKKSKKLPKIKKNHHLIELALDAEFTENKNLSLQVRIKGEICGVDIDTSLIIIDNSFKDHIFKKQKLLDKKITLEPNHENPKNIIFIKFNNLNNSDKNIIMHHVLEHLEFQYGLKFNSQDFFTIYLYFYYSIRDLYVALGRSNVLNWALGNKSKGFKKCIQQRRSIMGTILSEFSFKNEIIEYKIYLKDLFGWETWGLKTLIESSGLSGKYLESKESMDLYKECMDVALIEKTNEFLLYGIADAQCLIDIVHIKIRTLNSILTDIYNINDPDAYYTIRNIPFSLGRLVNKTWQIFIQYVVFQNNPIYLLAFNKTSILNPLHFNHSDNVHLFDELNKIKYFSELKKNLENNENTDFKLLLLPNVFKYSPSKFCSIRYLIDNSMHTNTYLLAMTSGGRTNNERPDECEISYGADVDLLSAYGSELVKLYFPYGRPRIYSLSHNDSKGMTLGEFMNQNLSKMQKYKLFKIVVSGQLSFEQDLLYSKIPSERSSEKKVLNFTTLEVGQQLIPNKFLLLRKEIIYSSITYDTFMLLKKVCSNLEFSEILNLEVKSALYYYNEDACENLESYLETIMETSGNYTFSQKSSAIEDTRSYKFFVVKVADFIEPLLEQRKILKKLKDDPEAQAIQHVLKYIINTFWGNLTSVFFDSSNVILSEQVTSAVRNKVWMVTKAFYINFCVTDGRPFSLLEVVFLKSSLISFKLPGLALLADYKKYKSNRNVVFAPLAGIDWKTLFDNNVSPYEGEFKNLDNYANSHLKEFWRNYGVDIDFTLEHKLDRTFIKGAYISKAHYALIVYNQESKVYDKKDFVIRAFKKNSKIQYENPVYWILNHILDNTPLQKGINDIYNIQNDCYFQQIKILKISSWKQSLDNPTDFNNYTNFNSSLGHIFPGNSYIIEISYRLNNLHCHILDYNDFKSRYKRILRVVKIKDETGVKTTKMRCFEKYLATKGILTTLEIMNNNNLKIQ